MNSEKQKKESFTEGMAREWNMITWPKMETIKTSLILIIMACTVMTGLIAGVDAVSMEALQKFMML